MIGPREASDNIAVTNIVLSNPINTLSTYDIVTCHQLSVIWWWPVSASHFTGMQCNEQFFVTWLAYLAACKTHRWCYLVTIIIQGTRLSTSCVAKGEHDKSRDTKTMSWPCVVLKITYRDKTLATFITRNIYGIAASQRNRHFSQTRGNTLLMPQFIVYIDST